MAVVLKLIMCVEWLLDVYGGDGGIETRSGVNGHFGPTFSRDAVEL